MSEVKQNELAILVKDSGVEESTATALLDALEPFYLQAKEWADKAQNLVVTDVTQVELMKDADIARKAVKKIRTSIEGRRKELKEDSLKMGKAIDSAANLLKGLIEPIEAHLELQATFAERMEAEIKAKIKEAREALLQPLGVNTEHFNLADMAQEQFNSLLTDLQNAYNQRVEDARRAKEQEELKAAARKLHDVRRLEIAPYLQFTDDTTPEFLGELNQGDFEALISTLRNAKADYDKEQIAIRAENERLRKEQKEAAELLAAKNQLRNERYAILRKYNATDDFDLAEMNESEFEARANHAKLQFEEAELARIAAEQKAAAEREEAKRIADELQRAKDLEAQRLLKEAEAKEAELAMGDSAKVEALKADLEALKTKYAFKSAKHKKLSLEVNTLLDKVVNHIIGKQ